MPEVLEFKDARGDYRMRVISKGRITDSTREGYKNKQDMIDAKVNASIAILRKYAPEKLN